MYEKAEAHTYIRKPLLKTGKPTILTLLDIYIYIFLKPKLRFYPLFKKNKDYIIQEKKKKYLIL